MIKSKKSLSQNFLIDKNITRKIINEITIQNKKVIEFGSGKGFLTDFIISKKPKKLILIEKDKYLIKYLKKKYIDFKNIEIIHEDILNINLSNYKNFNILGNIPYNISSKILKKIIFNANYLNEVVLMVQKEFALKCDYKKGKINQYKFMLQLCSDYKICSYISPNVFIPKPKVFSAIVKIKLKKNNINWNKMMKFINTIFKNKRKKIINNIKIKKNEDISIDLNKRIEELNFKEILTIYNFF